MANPEEIFAPIIPHTDYMNVYHFQMVDAGGGPHLRVSVNGQFQDFPLSDTQIALLAEQFVIHSANVIRDRRLT